MEVFTFHLRKIKNTFYFRITLNFDFIQNLNFDKIELIEEEMLKKAMDIAEEENDFFNEQEALNFLKYENCIS